MQFLPSWSPTARMPLRLHIISAYLVRLQVFSGKRSTRTEQEVIANAALQQEWRRLQGLPSAEPAEPAEPAEASKPIEGDCAICYDDMHPGGTTKQVLTLQEPGDGLGHFIDDLICVALVQFSGFQVHSVALRWEKTKRPCHDNCGALLECFNSV